MLSNSRQEASSPVVRYMHGRRRSWLSAATAFLFALTFFAGITPSQNSDADIPTNLLAHLNAAINWYKNLTTQVPPGQEPSDTIYSTNAENLGAQVVRVAFQSARAQAALTSQANANNNGQNAQSTSGESAERYSQVENEVSQRIADDQSKIDALKANSSRNANAATEEQSLEGKLALDQATLNAVQQMKKFVENSNSGGTGLERSINELARSVPEVFNSNSQSSGNTGAAAANDKGQAVQRSGLLGQLVILYKEMLSIRSIEQRLSENDEIQTIANNLRAPLRTKLTDTVQQGKTLGAENGVSKAQYDALTQQFKQLSAALLPLSEEILVLDQSRSNLLNWRSAHATESRRLLVSIVFRVAVIALAIGIIFGLAEAWRRLTFRYVRDPRRRRQFLVLRRFIMGFFICLVIVMGFISEFSSLATFAGFVTAGIAVGLQTVLLSVAAYFFVIGKYGIRIGDRISIAGVTGDVVDLGLVRFYVMEYAASGPDLFPTGRIVVFSNSVLFQATTPLYKQLPGTHYTWHEAVLPLANGADQALLQKSLHEAAQSVFNDFSREAEWQQALNYNMEITVKPPAPEQRLQFGDTGAELVVRYPVDLHRSAEMDERMVNALMAAMTKNQNVGKGIAGTPKIRTAVKV
jgi:small-conductance mechanosensitive channel